MSSSMTLEQAISQLKGPGLSFPEAAVTAPRKAGLYSLHASDAVWTALGLGQPPDARPLYVGKSESTLLERPIGQHFGGRTRGRIRTTSITGYSSPRRSLAALLATTLKLQTCPRNKARPGYLDRYGLDHDGDGCLTDWMRQRLRISFAAVENTENLSRLEEAVQEHWEPPLNIELPTVWAARIVAARQVLTQQATQWQKLIPT